MAYNDTKTDLFSNNAEIQQRVGFCHCKTHKKYNPFHPYDVYNMLEIVLSSEIWKWYYFVDQSSDEESMELSIHRELQHKA